MADDAFGFLVACGRSAVARAPGIDDTPERRTIATELRAVTSAISDWDAVTAMAETHGMLPLMCAEVLRTCRDVVPEPVVKQLLVAQRAATARSLAAVRQLVGVVAALDRAGVTALPYKGPLLARDAYGDGAVRSFEDLDVVVQPRDLERAATALAADGYVPMNGVAWPAACAENRSQGHVAFTRHADEVPVELHWRFCNRKLPWSPRVTDVIARATPSAIAGRELRVPSAEDQATLVVLHAARHGWDHLEAIVCLAAFAGRVRGPELLSALGAVNGRRAGLTGLALAARLLSIEWPAAVRDAIADDPATLTRAAEAERRLRSGSAGVARDVRLHLGLLETSVERANYLLRAIAEPTPADRKAVAVPGAFAPLYPLVRVFRLVVRAFVRWRDARAAARPQ